MLTLLVEYHAKPGQREAFIDGFTAAGFPAVVRNEAGCLCYDYYLPEGDPDRIILLEKWESVESQKLHVARPHMAVLRGLKEQYVEKTVLTTLNLL